MYHVDVSGSACDENSSLKMDDLALLDLLECPVCFEKLDATAKVLPCQHTFCKPCLQRILKSQKELRCPECRTLVLCSIEQLPSNLLLIRLLDGVRCGQNVTRFGSIQRSGVLSSPASIRRVPRGLQLNQYRLAPNPRIHMEGVPRAQALYTYRGHSPGELRFNKGDIIMLLRQLDENWYLGEINGISGVFPASSVQVIKHLPLPPPLCRALYNFDLRSRDKNENKDCLTFHKGDIITVISRVDENWAEGKLGDKVGIFPILFVEPNTTARQLLQTSKSHRSPQFKYASPLRTASPKSKDTDSPTFHKVSDSRRKSLRQFSITTALNTLNRMVHSPSDRQTLEISSPVLISSSNPTVATQSSEKVEFPYGTPLQVSASYYPAPGSLGHSAAIVTLPHLQHHVSANMCVALHSYMAHGPDELELQKGEGVRVFGKYHDGWLRGMSLVTGRVGIFPSNYVAPLFRKSNLPDSKMPSLYASWTLSTSSLSSQGSISENGQRQSRPLKSALLPMPMTSPGRNTAMLTTSGQTSLRRGRGSTRKNGSLQRPGQPGTPIHVAGSLRRLPATALRPQQFQLYQHISPQPHNIPSGAAMTDVGTRPNLSHDASPAPVVRGGESKTPSVCSSVILDAKDPPAKSETAPKPPASAPPSILVKPDTSRNSTEKQVKTVRFQNYSPPPSKRHSLQPSPSLPRGKMEQGAAADALLSEANLMGTELTVLYSPRISSSPVHQRRVSHPKASSLDLSGQAGQLTFPIKKNYSSISAN
nr:PREDICTED: putative E3 ubiquitin-protein ligase SH3RF2 isoform X1 [Struthio camelus australis]XP_009676962.1 PREDICTED: putative E3 ubiquitin-protein ligase SH3RF2 isoform X1 [Struthio camelus australis]XP_009676969.1 PREDICTED: putative E3 ubiquitin-protein ligase SH3RF2 isoform X1 [Struthio camelus australis]XP_009676977.1 PREDICTED: putative E3 ubiquitin-protein ligase SH3RF2 isoform X1 [Struthio camelus australis]